MIVTRTERQSEGIERWKKAGGIGTMLYCTGFGKTTVALQIAQRLVDKRKEANVVVIVPTDYLYIQWMQKIVEKQLHNNVRVMVINTAVKYNIKCNLLIVDEVHVCGAETFSQIFTKSTYNMLLCLTGTLDRLDKKEELIKKYAPICDQIDLKEAIDNDWLSNYREYKVLIETDLTQYKIDMAAFTQHFSYFGFNFNLAMDCIKDIVRRRIYAKQIGASDKEVMIQAMGFIRHLQAKNKFITNHPMKIEIANKILAKRQDSKAITFSAFKGVADQMGGKFIVHSSIAKAKKKKVIDEFCALENGVIHSVKAMDVGADIPGLNLAIILAGTSSSIQKRQRLGRALRKEGDKVSEVFNLVIKGTSEEAWYQNSTKGLDFITIDEAQLLDILDYKEIEDTGHEEKQFMFRF